jgi:AbrB family looped-hinge helix DNA binding protein
MPSDIIDGMRKLLKVDAAGRVVLPQPVRKRFHLTPGSRLEIDVEPDGIRLRPSTPAPSLTDEDGLLVHEGEPTGDLLHAVEEARALRDEQVNSALG